MKVSVTTVLLFTSLSAFAKTAEVALPADCTKRVQQIAALIPGDDGTFSKPSDVVLSNVQRLSTVINEDTAQSINYSLNISVAGFTGTAKVSDTQGSCYIFNFNVSAP